MKKAVLALLIVGCFGLGFAQGETPRPRMEKPMARMGRFDMLAKLKLTDEQKSKMKDIKFETTKKGIDLRAKLALSKLELGRLVSADEPDKAEIEKKMNEIASNKVALDMNKLNGWFEVNKILTPEQQKIWHRVLARRVMARMAEHREGPMRRMERGHRGAMMPGGMGPMEHEQNGMMQHDSN
ncbi:MAG TPA: periplasmic heavy metal sensor [Bacteroidota bacterium]|nr:periplasmic heavy metal sensor [Bacteroidota bacterium]